MRGFCRITLDESFVVRDIRIVQVHGSGRLFVAFPARRKYVRCGNRACLGKRDPGDSYCPTCGSEQRPLTDEDLRYLGHWDCCFPKTRESRTYFQGVILGAFEQARDEPGVAVFDWDGIVVSVEWVRRGSDPAEIPGEEFDE